jgi:GTP-binding protein EngB required for normal cell division
MATSPDPNLGSRIVSSLRNEKGVELLDTIDKLRGLGVDSDIPLPQIVVVGQQSSGKSSVLEAISGIPFPTNDGLCTRFPLEVIMRRGVKERVAVQLICKSVSFGHDEKPLIDSFYDELKAMDPIRLENVPNIVLMASKALGVDHGQAISSHVLRIEVTGPKQDHLTLIDLPGLFYVTKNDNDSASPALVKLLAQRYMKQPRTIILAIVSAKSDYATQEILKTLEDTDPDGSRTMGVITGLDTVENGSAREKEYMALAMNDEIPLVRGWHVLRNLNFKERQGQNFDRNDIETRFFSETEPWSTLPTNARGAQTLKTKLSQHLMQLIGGQMKNVVAALKSKIDDCNKTLEKLGPERSSMKDKRVYLFEIGTKHQNLVRAALNGPYSDVLFTEPRFRLRAQVRAHGDAFASKMRKKGHTWQVLEGTQSNGGSFEDLEYKSYAIGADPSLFVDHEPLQISKKAYLEKVEAVLVQQRTFELHGMFDPLVVGVLFRNQSLKWKELARKYIEDTKSMVTGFLHSVTKHLADPRRAQLLFARQIQPALEVREQVLGLRLVELLKPFTKHHPITCNDHFDNVAGYQESKADMQSGDNTNPENGETSRATEQAVRDHPAAHNLMEHMQNYYNVAIRTFVDNVITLGIESCLLDELDTLLSPLAMARLNDEEVDRLASDSTDDSERRCIAKSKLEKLEFGRAVCQQYDDPVAAEEDAQLSMTVKENATTAASPSAQQKTPDWSLKYVSRAPSSQATPPSAEGTKNPFTSRPGSAPAIQRPTSVLDFTGPTSGQMPLPANPFSIGRTSPISLSQPNTVLPGGLLFKDAAATKPGGSGLLGSTPSISPSQPSKPTVGIFALSTSGSTPLGTSQSSLLGSANSTTAGGGSFGSKSSASPFGGGGVSGSVRPPSRSTCEPTPPNYPPHSGVRLPMYAGSETYEILQSITATSPYSKWSFEELRLADINAGRCLYPPPSHS